MSLRFVRLYQIVQSEDNTQIYIYIYIYIYTHTHTHTIAFAIGHFKQATQIIGK